MNEFDENSFGDTATFLWDHNPSVATSFRDIAAFRDWMRELAVNEIDAPGYVATFGFVLIAIKPKHLNGEIYYRAALDPGCVISLLARAAK